MKTYYCVTSSFYDNGRVVAAITDSCQADHKPESRFYSGRRADVYTDWFADLAEAQQFAADARNA